MTELDSTSSTRSTATAFSLAQHSALVIGASRGIGEAIARALFASGANVTLASRDTNALERLANELDASGNRVLVVRTDMTDGASVQNAVAQTVSRFGRLDIAVNNAGIQNPRTPFIDTSDDDFDHLLGVNLRGVFIAMKYELRAMAAAGRGSIINVASSAGLIGLPLIAPYVASKHGVIGLTKCAAVEYAAHGIRVNAVAPGLVMTEMVKAGPLATAQSAAAILSRIPMGRVAEVDEVAGAVVWLASAASSYVTGVALPIDGGFTTL
jgi:NAD(P)-dependent dehydrogenase (short-subunit alcohol dehydrogenase family)